MNKEDFIGKLQMVYVGDKRASEEIISEYDRLNNIIKELSKDVDMWNKKYNEQFDIINELEKVFIECDYQHLQRKLKCLKENNKDG